MLIQEIISRGDKRIVLFTEVLDPFFLMTLFSQNSKRVGGGRGGVRREFCLKKINGKLICYDSA